MNPEGDSDESQDPSATDRPRINGSAVQVNGRAVAVNGAAVHEEGADADAPIAGLEEVAWRPSYDRESVNRYLAEVEAEKSRLLAEIRLAEEREAAAQERYRTKAATERDAVLGALLLAARAETDRVETEHRETVAAIQALADEESATIRDRAQAEAAAVREAVASLAAISTAGESIREAVASLAAATSADETTPGAGAASSDEADGDDEGLTLWDQGHAG